MLIYSIITIIISILQIVLISVGLKILYKKFFENTDYTLEDFLNQLSPANFNIAILVGILLAIILYTPLASAIGLAICFLFV